MSPPRVLFGKPVADSIIEKAKENLNLEKKPSLIICLVGDDKASKVYIQRKVHACQEIGINSKVHQFSKNTNQDEILDVIESWNQDDNIHGIIIQLPLPLHLDARRILSYVDPIKDVDGFHPSNIGELAYKNNKYVHAPCTPSAICELLDFYKIPLSGKNCVIINHSIVVGKPLSWMFLARNATVTVCHEYTENLSKITKEADIIVSAVGRRPFFTLSEQYVNQKTTVIDVGITRTDSCVLGDADASILSIVEAITPVPKGVGPVTVACLVRNTINSFKLIENIYEKEKEN